MQVPPLNIQHLQHLDIQLPEHRGIRHLPLLHIMWNSEVEAFRVETFGLPIGMDILAQFVMTVLDLMRQMLFAGN